MHRSMLRSILDLDLESSLVSLDIMNHESVEMHACLITFLKM